MVNYINVTLKLILNAILTCSLILVLLLQGPVAGCAMVHLDLVPKL